MKFTFQQNELSYLHQLVSAILARAPKDVEPVVIRTFSKMRWKFTPTALYVNLTGKERNVLSSMLNYRLVQLNQAGPLNEEGNLVDSLLGKLMGGTSDAA